MGILIGLEHISHEWPGKQTLVDQTVGIHEGDRIGIVGKNGDGKSTLLRIIAQRLQPSQGDITYRKGIHVGYLGQSDSLSDDDTVLHAVVGDVPEYVWASNPAVREVLSKLLGDIDWNTLVGTLSGGQRRRCDLAKLLIGTWDVLLLDEPTNHLDVETISWLASYLKRLWPAKQGALLVVTHDRWFLDEVATSMWEVHDGRIDPFEGGYSAYIQQRLERDRAARVAEDRRQNMLRKELAWLSRGPKARTSKPKFRIEEAKALIADVPPLRNPLELKRMAVSRLGKKVVELKDVSFSYDDNCILDNISWIIGPGDRYGILGQNGVGKSTLLRIIEGQLTPQQGFVKIGKTVKFGILSQRLDNIADKQNWRVRELIATYKSSYVIDGKEVSASALLERLGFDKGDFDSFIKDLSGGQARRLCILCVLMEEPNVLILDEPGNDLDTDMLAVLEDVLDGWPGTLLMVSHDRYLMERVCDDEFALLDGKIVHMPGGVDEYLSIIAAQNAVQAANASIKTVAKGESDAAAQKNSQPNGLSNQERHEAKKRFDAISRKLDKLSGEPDAIRNKMAQVDPSDFEKLTALQTELDEAQAQIDALEEEWIELADLLELG